jgi:hypothetical protein
MNEILFKSIECCRNKNFKHFAKDASTLSCGHYICKECLPTNECAIIKCDLCGETNEIKLDVLRKSKEPYSIKFLFSEYIKGIFNETTQRLQEALNQFKGIFKDSLIIIYNFINSFVSFKRYIQKNTLIFDLIL